MSKIVTHEFMGSWFLVFLLSITGIGIPVALVYLFYSTIRVETSMENPEKFVAEYRAGKLAQPVH